jgi:uncharacterized membrane protein YhaH (DUF805 family)
MMKTSEKKIWFPAKKYGWGWGPPCAWQGWVAIVVFVVLLGAAGVLLLPGKHFSLWIAAIIGLVAALIITCLVQGERPHWRWGKD